MGNSRPWRPSAALIVSVIALVVALGGTSYAAFTLPANSVGTKQLKNGAVTNEKLGNGSVGTARIKNGAVTNEKLGDGSVSTAKIKNGAVTGPKMNFGGVTVPKANIAVVASFATSAVNAAQLGGVAASGYAVRGCNAQAGAIKGWAAVTNASASFPSTYVSVPGYNCSGGTVQARRLGVGMYEVQFVNSPVTVMVATVNGGANPAGFVDSHKNGPGDFVIGTRNVAGALEDGHGFALITP